MQQRTQRPRAAKTAAIKKIAAIAAYERAPLPQPKPIKTYQFPFLPTTRIETHEEITARLKAQMKYYKEHPYVPKKPIIVRIISYLKKVFK